MPNKSILKEYNPIYYNMNPEIIQAVYNVEIEKIPLHNDNTFCGFYVQTNKQVIKALIDDYNLSHEKFGVLMFTSNKIHNFNGLLLKSISYGKEIDYSLVPYKMTDISLTTCPHIIINLETDKGFIQVVLYNEHDGSYPHHTYITWDNEYKYQIL